MRRVANCYTPFTLLTLQHSTGHSSSDNIPSLLPDSHHRSVLSIGGESDILIISDATETETSSSVLPTLMFHKVATYATCGGTFNIHLTANLPRNLPVNVFDRLRFDRIITVTSLWPHFFGPPCTQAHAHHGTFDICSTRPHLRGACDAT